MLVLALLVLFGGSYLAAVKIRTQMNKHNIEIVQKETAVADVQPNTSTGGSFGNIPNESATPTLDITLTPSPSPTPTTTPKPPTPTPIKDDLQLTRFYIQGQYSSPTTTTADSQGNPESYTFEEHIGINAFYVADSIKNNGPNTIKNIKHQLWVNGKLQSEKIIDQLSANEEKNLVDFYLPQSPATYSLEIKVNPDHIIIENNYGNNTLSRKFIVINDKTAPEIRSIDVYRDLPHQQSCLVFSVSDNVSSPNEIKYQEKLDGEEFHEITWDHSQEAGYQRCLSGPVGEPHVYTLKVRDNRGNENERSYGFQLLGF